jgi:hypothetical protein
MRGAQQEERLWPSKKVIDGKGLTLDLTTKSVVLTWDRMAHIITKKLKYAMNAKKG